MAIARRTLLRSTAAVVALPGIIGSAFAQKAEFTYKYANNLPATHPMNIRAREMAAAVLAESKGRVEIQIFPASQLGNDTDMLSQLRAGGIEFFTLSGLILSTLVPGAAITGLGFIFADYDSVWKALDGELGGHVRKEIGKSGLVVMEHIWDNGFRQITSSSKPIHSAEDLKGFKIRVPVSPMWTSLFKAFDSSPASINFAEVYSALQTRVVDGQENPLAVIETAKLYEVQKYCSMTNHMWDGFWFLSNRRAWERLPDELRAMLARHINGAALKQRADVAALNATLQKSLSDKGMVFNMVKTDSFRSRLRQAGFYSEWKTRFGHDAWAVLERHSGQLA